MGAVALDLSRMKCVLLFAFAVVLMGLVSSVNGFYDPNDYATNVGPHVVAGQSESKRSVEVKSVPIYFNTEISFSGFHEDETVRVLIEKVGAAYVSLERAGVKVDENGAGSIVIPLSRVPHDCEVHVTGEQSGVEGVMPMHVAVN